MTKSGSVGYDYTACMDLEIRKSASNLITRSPRLLQMRFVHLLGDFFFINCLILDQFLPSGGLEIIENWCNLWFLTTRLYN